MRLVANMILFSSSTEAYNLFRTSLNKGLKPVLENYAQLVDSYCICRIESLFDIHFEKTKMNVFLIRTHIKSIFSTSTKILNLVKFLFRKIVQSQKCTDLHSDFTVSEKLPKLNGLFAHEAAMVTLRATNNMHIEKTVPLYGKLSNRHTQTSLRISSPFVAYLQIIASVYKRQFRQ